MKLTKNKDYQMVAKSNPKRIWLCGALFATAVAMGAPTASSVAAAGEDPPLRDNYWPECTEAEEQYCVELLQFTPPGGSTVTYEHPTTGYDPYSDLPWVDVIDGRGLDREEGTPVPNFMTFEIQNFQMWGTDGQREEGLEEGEYRVVLRTGTFDPTFFSTKGLLDDYQISKVNSYWRIDATMTPALIPERFGRAGCNGITWKTNPDCEYALSSYERGITGTVFMITNEDEGMEDLVAAGYSSNDLRGIWRSSNALITLLPEFNWEQGSINAVAFGPHYLPDRWATDWWAPDGPRSAQTCEQQGLLGEPDMRDRTVDDQGDPIEPQYDEEGNRIYRELCLTPARDVTYLPFKALTALSRIPVDIVKDYFSKDAVTATVEGKIKKNISIVIGEDGVTIDFKLEHFSLANPKLKVKKPMSLKGGDKLRYDKIFTTLPKNATFKSLTIIHKKQKGTCSIVGTGKFVEVAKSKSGFCSLKIEYKSGSKVFVKTTVITVKKK